MGLTEKKVGKERREGSARRRAEAAKTFLRGRGREGAGAAASLRHRCQTQNPLWQMPAPQKTPHFAVPVSRQTSARDGLFGPG